MSGRGFQAPETLGPIFDPGDDVDEGREVDQPFEELMVKLE